MTPAEFLRLVWPAEGYYALATPFTPNGQTKSLYAHKVFDSIDAAAEAAAKLKSHTDVYFCVHSLREPKVWNPKKIDRKTGATGAYEVRVQSNMHMGRALFLDLDVGPEAGKYATQAEAVLGLRNFTVAAHLPKPIVTSSGGGLHVYWPLSQSMSSTDWRDLAAKLKIVATHHGLRIDPSRTTDTASVLRVPGTFNLKDRANPRPVRLLLENSEPTSNDVMVRLLDEDVIRNGLTLAPTKPPALSPAQALLGSNTQLQSGPPVGFPALVAACNQVKTIVAAKGNVSEPFWYALLGLVRYCEDGRKAAHFISRGHPNYSASETDEKLDQLESKLVGPTTCERIESTNPGGCDGCPRRTTIKSPLTAARYTEQAPAPVIPAIPEMPATIEIEIPPPPQPFMRLKTGAIAIEVGNKENPDQRDTQIILPYDFYPLQRMHDPARGVETHVWNADLPRIGYVQIVLDADAMYDQRKLSSALANKGVFPHGENVNLLRSYMVAYINTLQASVDASTLHSCLGWNDDYSAFTLPDKVLHADGKVIPANISTAVERATTAIHKAGTQAAQSALLKFFDHPEYAANQFSICASLGAPIFFATGHHGVVVNMSGPPGASKSTTLYTAASLWGDPLSFCINGTTRGATHNARDNRMTITANLPQMVDEITRMNPKDAADLAMGVTQSEGRIRLDSAGMERKTIQSNKSTIMLCTANTSLYTILSAERADSTAESMRVFEMQFDLARVHKKHEADEYLSQLRKNYGHIGEVFMRHVVLHREEVVDRVRQIMRVIDNTADIQSGERFWSAAAAASITACEIANKLGLLPYNPKTIWHWLISTQIPSMRGTLTEQYSTPMGVLSEYMESINGNMLVLHRGTVRNHENIPNIIRQPEHGQLLARLEQDNKLMWVLKKPFKDYCVKHGHNFTRIIDYLTEKKVITKKHDRKVLGGGTDYAKGQSWCFVVSMAHRDVRGEILGDTDAVVLSFPPTKIPIVDQEKAHPE